MSKVHFIPLKSSGMQKAHMANGGFRFLLVDFQYLVG
jgi:hypothetical protein